MKKGMLVALLLTASSVTRGYCLSYTEPPPTTATSTPSFDYNVDLDMTEAVKPLTVVDLELAARRRGVIPPIHTGVGVTIPNQGAQIAGIPATVTDSGPTWLLAGMSLIGLCFLPPGKKQST